MSWIWAEEIPQKMWPLGVRDLLWAGKKTEERLLAYGINTIGDLARISVGQLGLGVSKLTHEPYEQLSLFEDPRMEYYREWDRLYDEEKAVKDTKFLTIYQSVCYKVFNNLRLSLN